MQKKRNATVNGRYVMFWSGSGVGLLANKAEHMVWIRMLGASAFRWATFQRIFRSDRSFSIAMNTESSQIPGNKQPLVNSPDKVLDCQHDLAKSLVTSQGLSRENIKKNESKMER